MESFKWFGVFKLFLVISLLATGVRIVEAGESKFRISSPFEGTLTQLDVDTDQENFLVTSNSSSSIVVWSIDEPGKKAILRIPLSDRERFRRVSVAISPDGKYVAVAPQRPIEQDDQSKLGGGQIFVFDRHQEQLVSPEPLIKNIPSRLNQIRFSPDGKYLVAALAQSCGVMIWSFKDGRKLDQVSHIKPAIERIPAEAPCGQLTEKQQSGAVEGNVIDVESLAFLNCSDSDPENLWFMTAGDLGVSAYRKIGDKVHLAALLELDQFGINNPWGLNVSKDCHHATVGDRKGTKVALLRSFDLDRESGFAITSVFHLPDAMFKKTYIGRGFLTQTTIVEHNHEKWILAGGYLPKRYLKDEVIDKNADFPDLKGVHPDYLNVIVRWNMKKPDAPEFFVAGIDTVMGLRFLQRRGFIALATQRRVALLPIDVSPANEVNLLVLGQKTSAAMNGKHFGFAISKDAKVVRFENYPVVRGSEDGQWLEFDLDSEKMLTAGSNSQPLGLETSPSSLTGKELLQPSYGGDVAENFYQAESKTEKRPMILGYEILSEEMADFEIGRWLAAQEKQNIAVWGTSNFVRVITDQGIACSEPVRSEAWRVNLTPNGRIVVVAHGDGALRWYGIAWNDDDTRCRLRKLLTVYMQWVDGEGWHFAAWRPGGHFFASYYSSGFAGWEIDNPSGEASIAPLHSQFYLMRPDKVRQALDEKVEFAPSDDGSNDLQAKLQNITPKFSIQLTQSLQYPNDRAEPDERRIDQGEVDLTVNVSGDAAELDTTRFRITVDGHPTRHKIVFSDENPDDMPWRKKTQLFDLSSNQLDKEFLVRVRIPSAIRKKEPTDSFPICIAEENLATSECPNFRWSGKARKREHENTLRAILVGFSQYDVPSLDNLRWSHHDALDFAFILTKKFVDQLELTKSGEIDEPDFDKLSINLILSAKENIEDLDSWNYIKKMSNKYKIDIDLKFKIYKRNDSEKVVYLRNIVEDIAKNDSTNIDSSDDLLIFLFSGHGANYHIGRDENIVTRNVLYLPNSKIDKDYMIIDDVKKSIESLNYSKIIIIDACRNGEFYKNNASQFTIKPRKSTKLRTAQKTYWFFSTQSGDPTYEQPFWSISRITRPDFDFNDFSNEDIGNSMFSLAALLGLICEPNELYDRPDRVSVSELKRYMKWLYRKPFSSLSEKLRERTGGRFSKPKPEILGDETSDETYFMTIGRSKIHCPREFRAMAK